MDTSDWVILGAAILTGGGTLFLGIMAWRTIRQTRNLQKAEKRERLLNEIIEWAEDVARLNFKIYNFIEAQISKESWVENVIGEIVSQFQVVEVKGDYINSIALSSFKGERKLSKAVKAVNKEIRELGDVSIKRLAKEVSSEVVKEHMDKLRLKIADLLKEVAKIKTRSIS